MKHAKYLNTYYGQLAFVEMNHGEKLFRCNRTKKNFMRNLKKNLIRNPLVKSQYNCLNELDAS